MSLLDKVLKKCQQVESLAEGGQKKVLRGIHSEFGPIVIKVGSYRFSTKISRIAREVETLREIDSEYYPKNYEFLVDETSKEFVVIEEYLNAEELGNVKDMFTTDKEILNLLNQLICALSILWKKRKVHRDIKPANILITSKGEPRIIDLGILRDLGKTSLTETIALAGPRTPIYAAPEQIQNEKMEINERTDFFLLGLLVLELLLGFHPYDPKFVKNQQSLVENILTGDYVLPNEQHDEKLIGFIIKALETKPYKRFRTVYDIFEFLEMEC